MHHQQFWFYKPIHEPGFTEFKAWLNENLPNLELNNVARVWDVDREKVLESMFKLFQAGFRAKEVEIKALQEKLDLCAVLIAARQDININFSLFRKKP